MTDIGIWLEDIDYTTVPTVPTGVSGTLRYTVSSILHDKDDQPGHFFGHKVNILGFNARPPADLVPDSDDPQFCEKDERGRLVVGVANQGQGEAPVSVARVRFRPGGTVDRAAPPVPAGFASKLEPIPIPDGCGADCASTISVDVRDEVTEANEGNNISDGQCIG